MAQQSPGERRHDVPVALIGLAGVLIGAVATVVVALIGRSTGTVYISTQSQPSAAATTVTVAPPPVPASTVTVTSEPSDGQPPLPDGVKIRRESAKNLPITLTPGYGADLDDIDSPNWAVAEANLDVRYLSEKLYFEGSDAALETTDGDYALCARETAYNDHYIEREELRRGTGICIRTSDHRYAYLKVSESKSSALTFSALVWDPPYQE